ncbi:MAG: DUF6163 family protein [Pseudolabrys sp.]
MTDRIDDQHDDPQGLEPVHTEDEHHGVGIWTLRLILFLRVMAGVSMIKGLFHWAALIGIGAGPHGGFETHSVSWQAATIFFAVLDLIAAVGLWLAATWGAVVWLASIASMLVLNLFFPQVFESWLLIDLLEAALLFVYVWLAIRSAQEQTK